MYLKSIYIQGFKSFPDRITVSFGDGMTAIVGPNGSGKSNICDAIRWVLGEQSTKTLRGAKMEDVIFNGTQSRPAVGFAEVALTIDNSSRILSSDYDEVTVGRRYYRSGESEYYINKKPVRLKDVNELLMDTGLGRDGYSIIGQGRIAEILSVKSEDRRQMFEEAAGISKYRYKKSEAERRLSQTDDNLSRVGDITAELEGRIGPLSEQAERAKRFLALRDEKRELEVGLWLLEIAKIRESLQKQRDDLTIAETTLMLNKKTADETDAEIESLRDRMRAKDIEAERLKEALFEQENKITRLDGEIELLNSAIENNLSSIQRLKENSSFSEADAGELETRLEEQNSRRSVLEAEHVKMEGELAALLDLGEKADIGMEGDKSRLEAISTRMAAIGAAISEHRVAISAAEARKDTLSLRMGAIDEEISARQAELLTCEEQMAAGKKELRDVDEAILSADNMAAGYKKKLEAREARLNEARERFESTRRELSEKTARMEMLRELEKSYEGFGRSVKIVMQEAARGRLKNICGPLSRLIEIDPRYAVAMEVALGSAMQNIVTETDADAKAAIRLLKSAEGGRATFLPVDTIRPSELREKGVSEQPGFVGIASYLVECEPKYKNIVKSLLSRIVVTDTLDSAAAMARAFSYRFRIVSLDGQVMNAGGSLTGGSFNAKTGIFSRASEQKELELRTRELSKSFGVLEKQSAELKSACGELVTLLGGCENERRTLMERRAGIVARIDGDGRALETLGGVIENLKNEKSQCLSAIEEGEVLRAASMGKIALLDDSRAKLEAEASLTEESRAQAARRRDEIHNDIMDRRLAINSLMKDIENTSALCLDLSDRIIALKTEKDKLIGEACALEEKNRELSAQIVMKEGERAAAFDMRAVIKTRIAETADQKLKFEGMAAARQKELKEQQSRLLELEREYARLESKIASQTQEEEAILNRMWEEYELTPLAAEKYRKEEGPPPGAARRIAQIKNEIKSLGNINIDAIEEYKLVKERFDFLTAQRDDLIAARDALLSIIDEMTNSMRIIFREQFAAINAAFSKSFKRLFGGGSASLELENPGDVLGSGIEIKVQPPGKKVKSMSLLSGGEQSFVAIALLLAILQVRPTPFCIFDEVESALDDVNVSRFCTYLEKYVDKTQFILITHRRGTMEHADMLYGVTMQEQGVSKLLAINVADVEKRAILK